MNAKHAGRTEMWIEARALINAGTLTRGRYGMRHGIPSVRNTRKPSLFTRIKRALTGRTLGSHGVAYARMA